MILASKSPRRKEIFSKLKIPFKTIKSSFEEDMTLDMPPEKLVKFLSHGKAQEVARKYPHHIVIGADTFVVLKNELLGKPRTPQIAKEMLKKISGNVVEIISGITITCHQNKKIVSKATTTKIYIRKLSVSEIDNYIKTGEPLDKAGAFAIQELGATLIKKVEGDYLSAIGLSLFETAKILKEFDIEIL